MQASPVNTSRIVSFTDGPSLYICALLLCVHLLDDLRDAFHRNLRAGTTASKDQPCSRNMMVLEESDSVPCDVYTRYTKLYTDACKNRRQNFGVLSKELVPFFRSHRFANIVRQILELGIQKPFLQIQSLLLLCMVDSGSGLSKI